MKDIGKILLYLVATVLVGALLAPFLFWGAHAAAGSLANQRLIDFLAKTDFQRFFNRAVLVAAVVLLWPLVRSLRIRNFGEDLGLHRDRRALQHFSSGFSLAFFSLLLLGIVMIGMHFVYIRDEVPWRKIAWLPLSAFGAATVEELLFRGGLQGAVRRTATDDFALVFVAVLFAAVHFLKPPENAIEPANISWWSGLALVPQAFWQFEEPKLLLGKFTTILLVGLILGLARARTHALWMPIGLHAGWVLGKMSFSKMTTRGLEGWPWFTNELDVGLATVCVLLFTGAIVWYWLRDAELR